MVIHVDKAVIAGLKDIMGDEYAILLEAYLTDSDQRLRLAQQAVAEHDSSALREAVHSFKGSCGNVGALELAHLCQALECAADKQNQSVIEGLLAQIKTEMMTVKAVFVHEIHASKI